MNEMPEKIWLKLSPQKIWLSEWCSYKCVFCYNGRKQFKEFPIPEIKYNHIQILDPAFLSKKDVIGVIKELGLKKVKGKVVYYELVQGINWKDLTQDIANELKKNRFIKIRLAWDRGYNRYYMFKIYDCKNMLIKAGYKPKDLAIFMLVNWLVPYKECLAKLDLLKIWGVRVADCCYNGGYHIKSEIDYNNNQNPRNWNYQQLKNFRHICRKHNQILRGIDPELK